MKPHNIETAVTPEMMKLDKADFEIISLLQKDGRMPFVKMAELLGVSEGTIRRKVSALIDSGTLTITGVCNPSALGFDAPAIVGISADQKKSEEVARQIALIPEVQLVVITTGPYEIMVHVLTKSNEDLFNMLLRIAELDGVKATQTFLTLRTYKQSGSTELSRKPSTTAEKERGLLKHFADKEVSNRKALRTKIQGRK